MSRLRIVLATLAAVAALGACAGLGVVFLGLYNTSARQGHWTITEWVLHTTFRNSVELRAPAPAAVPEDLADPALIELGARHFDGACRMCHARPGAVADATIASMVPRPPHIEDAVADWQPARLHWIVQEGVKMSGMPAWPDPDREDEVWAVVAFLQAVKDGMTAEDYADLTVPAEEGYCAGCHGPTGTPRAPRLGILAPEYIEMSLDAYRTGRRSSGIMSHAITQVEPEADARLAQALARLPGPTSEGSAEAVSDGRALAEAGTREVPSCLSCHGNENTNPLIPRLDGQGQEYLRQQLLLWREGQRGGGQRAVLMHEAADNLTDAQIDALAAFFAQRNGSPG